MRLTVKLFGILMLLLGVLLLINPTIIIGWMEDNRESTSTVYNSNSCKVSYGYFIYSSS